MIYYNNLICVHMKQILYLFFSMANKCPYPAPFMSIRVHYPTLTIYSLRISISEIYSEINKVMNAY